MISSVSIPWDSSIRRTVSFFCRNILDSGIPCFIKCIIIAHQYYYSCEWLNFTKLTTSSPLLCTFYTFPLTFFLLFFFFQTLNSLFCIGVFYWSICIGVINNVVVVSGEQQRDSAIHIHVSVLPQTPLPSRLLHNTEQSSSPQFLSNSLLSDISLQDIPELEVSMPQN